MVNMAGAWWAIAQERAAILVETQEGAIERAAEMCANAILNDGLVHTFGSGHSRVAVEELFPRYGSYPGFHPITELSTTFHTQVAGANGQRQAMFIERVPGLAEVILANYTFGPHDVVMVFSVSGTGALSIEMAKGVRARNTPVIAVTAAADGGDLAKNADLVIDLPAAGGDALVDIEGSAAKVGPVSTLLYAIVTNEIKVRVAGRLAEHNALPSVLAGAKVLGDEGSKAAFEAAYREHARRASRVLNGAGE